MTDILPDLKPVLKIADVTKVLPCSNQQILNLIHSGDLRAVRITPSRAEKTKREYFLVMAEDLRDFIRRRRGDMPQRGAA